ncbi:MAG: ribonuclease Y [bacterium]|nr:ribonuclease Y [bacterium]
MDILRWMLPSLILGATLGYFLRLLIGRIKLTSAEATARRILDDAEKESEAKKREFLLSAKDEIFRERNKLDDEVKQRRQELKINEDRLLQREINLEKRLEILEKKENSVAQLEKELKEKSLLLVQETDRIQKQLEKISGLTREDAKRLFLENVEKEARFEASKISASIEEEAKRSADQKAKEIIATAIQRNASEFTSELSVSIVPLPNEDMKGRIIGREGRNIRTLENLTGVDIIIDDTPDAVVISGYDPIRREIAKISLEKLILDGRIHPSRIEEIVEKVKADFEKALTARGEKVIFDLQIPGLHPELIKMIGRLNYRLSYGQNTLEHSIEVANLCSGMASELQLNIGLAKRVGLLHDIGKCLTSEIEGSHAIVGAEYAKKYNEDSIVVNAISAHHNDREPSSIYAIMVQAADAISASRPGARKENIDDYIKRLENLEHIASSFKGIEKSYAIQAGRELRIIVANNIVTDEEAKTIAKEIAKKVEVELKYPGQIKITVIRETRIIEYAK